MTASAPRTEQLIIFTDGACENNGKPDAKAGVGVFLGTDDPRNISLPLEKTPHTNNRAELWALKLALDIVAQENPLKATIHTDSQYAMNALTLWNIKWKKNGWMTASKKPVLNKDIIVELDSLLTQLKKTIEIEFIHVKGHTGELDGNHYADRLATEGIHVEINTNKRQRTD